MPTSKRRRTNNDAKILGLSGVIVNIDNEYIRSGVSSHPYLDDHLKKLDAAVLTVSRVLKRRHAAEDGLEGDLGGLASLLTPHTPVTALVSLCGEYGYGKTTVLVNYIARKSFELVRYLNEGEAEEKPSVIPIGIIYPHYMPPGDHPLAWLIYMLSNFIDKIVEAARKGTYRLSPKRIEMLEEAKNIIDNELSEVAAIVMADHRIVLSQVAASTEELLDDMARLSYAGMRFHSMYRTVSRYIRRGLGLHDVPLLIAFDDVDSEPSKIYETLLTVRLLSTDPNNVFIVAFRCNYNDVEEILALEMARALAGSSVLGERAVDVTRHPARTLLLKTLLSSVQVRLSGLDVKERLSFKPFQPKLKGRKFNNIKKLGELLKDMKIYRLFDCKSKSSTGEEILETPYVILLPPAPRSLSMLYFTLASQEVPGRQVLGSEAARIIADFIRERPTLWESTATRIAKAIKDISIKYIWSIYGGLSEGATGSRRIEIKIQPFIISPPKGELLGINIASLEELAERIDYLEGELDNIDNKLIIARVLERLVVEAEGMNSLDALSKSLYEATIMEINVASAETGAPAVQNASLRVPVPSLLHEWLTVLLARRVLERLNIVPIMHVSARNLKTVAGRLAGVIGVLYLAYLDSLRAVVNLVQQAADEGCVLKRELTSEEKRYYIPLFSALKGVAITGQFPKTGMEDMKMLASELYKAIMDIWDRILGGAKGEGEARREWYGLADFAGNLLSELGGHSDEVIRELAVKVREVLTKADDKLSKALSKGST